MAMDWGRVNLENQAIRNDRVSVPSAPSDRSPVAYDRGRFTEMRREKENEERRRAKEADLHRAETHGDIHLKWLALGDRRRAEGREQTAIECYKHSAEYGSVQAIARLQRPG